MNSTLNDKVNTASRQAFHEFLKSIFESEHVGNMDEARTREWIAKYVFENYTVLDERDIPDALKQLADEFGNFSE